jgi:hypothetical protein
VRFDHFLLTQFSIPAPQAPGRNRDEGWLRFRLDLLERLGAPSVRAQSTAAFRWVLLVDEASPAWVLERLEAITTDLPAIVLPVGSQWRASLDDFLTKRSLTDILLTSQMDSDDAIAPTFVREVQAHAGPETVINASVGARFDWQSGNLVRLRKKRAFESVCSTHGRNIFHFHHGRAGLELPSVELVGRPLWLQTIHGGNLANRSMRGFPIKGEEHFPWLSEMVLRPRVHNYGVWASEELRQLRHRIASQLFRRAETNRWWF